MGIVKPTDRKLKYDIRGRNWDGRIVRIPGERNLAATQRLKLRIEMLIKAKRDGDPPPGDLKAWIDNMDARLSARLVKLGLLTARRANGAKSLEDFIGDWQKSVQNRKPDSHDHAPQQGRKVRRIVRKLEATALDDLTVNKVQEAINGFQTLGMKKPISLSVATRHSYGVAIKDFAAWLSRNWTNPTRSSA